MNESRNILGIPVTMVLPNIAAHLARLDDELQAAFFQTFADELVRACGTNHAAEVQAAYINNKLKPEAREVFTVIGYKESNT